jgi:hypothetical protein
MHPYMGQNIKVVTIKRPNANPVGARNLHCAQREFAAMVDGTQAIPDNTDDTLLAALTYAVPIKVARSALGDKARSEIYEAAGRGELVLVKDGHKT